MARRSPRSVTTTSANHEASTMTPPDPAPVIDLIQAFRRSKTMFTAASMGIFDLLHEAPAAASEVAARLAANADATERLLDACAALGLLRKREGVYENDPVADTYLRAASPHTLCGRSPLPDVEPPGRRRARGHAALAPDFRPCRPDLQRFLPHR